MFEGKEKLNSMAMCARQEADQEVNVKEEDGGKVNSTIRRL